LKEIGKIKKHHKGGKHSEALNKSNKNFVFNVNPTRRGLWNGHRVGEGLLKPASIKTHLEAKML